jgi:hypothetical protein
VKKRTKKAKQSAYFWAGGLAAGAVLAWLAASSLKEHSHVAAVLPPGIYCPEGQEASRCACVGELSSIDKEVSYEDAAKLVSRGAGRIVHAEAGTCEDTRYLLADYGKTLGSQILYFGSGGTLVARARSSETPEFCKELGGSMRLYEGLLTRCEGSARTTEVLVKGRGKAGLPSWPSLVASYVQKPR